MVRVRLIHYESLTTTKMGFGGRGHLTLCIIRVNHCKRIQNTKVLIFFCYHVGFIPIYIFFVLIFLFALIF